MAVPGGLMPKRKQPYTRRVYVNLTEDLGVRLDALGAKLGTPDNVSMAVIAGLGISMMEQLVFASDRQAAAMMAAGGRGGAPLDEVPFDVDEVVKVNQPATPAPAEKLPVGFRPRSEVDGLPDDEVEVASPRLISREYTGYMRGL